MGEDGHHAWIGAAKGIKASTRSSAPCPRFLCSDFKEPAWSRAATVKAVSGVFGRLVSQPVFLACLLHLPFMLRFKQDAWSLLSVSLPEWQERQATVSLITVTKKILHLSLCKETFGSPVFKLFKFFSFLLHFNIKSLMVNLSSDLKRQGITFILSVLLSLLWASRQSFRSWCFPLPHPSRPGDCKKDLLQDSMHSAHKRYSVSYPMCMIPSRFAHCDWLPSGAKPRIASQQLIDNKFPSAFQHPSLESDSGLENWCQKPVAQDDRKENSFYLTKRMLPRQAGVRRRREGPFQNFTVEKEEPSVLTGLPFVSFLFDFCRSF